VKGTGLALLVLLLLAVPTAAHAQFTYSTNSDGTTLTITGYTGPGGVVTIPPNSDGRLVTGIGTNAFQDTSPTGVTIPGSVTSIGGSAFYGCPLASATIADGVTSIGDYAFYYCTRLARVTIPGSVTNFGDWAFGFSGLINVAIGNGVTSIGADAFYDCPSLTGATIPSSVTSIGDYAFFGCTFLTAVYFAGNPPAVDSTAFSVDDNVTAYYLPGTAGWGEFSTNTGVPAVLWNPLIQAKGPSFGVSNIQFGFNIIGTNNFTVMVETCTNLANPIWTPLQTVTLSNDSFYFSDPQWTNYSARYYGLGFP
jgi:hypothetical protein